MNCIIYTTSLLLVGLYSIINVTVVGEELQRYIQNKFESGLKQTGNGECLPVWFVSDHVTSHEGSQFKNPDLNYIETSN